MKVVVLMRRRRDRPDAPAGEALLGRCDDAALQTALALRGGDGRVTAVAAGASEREDVVLADALRAGADHALRVHDPGLAFIDYFEIARVLAAAAKKVGFDVILCGERSEDEAQGAVGPAVAEVLGIPHLTGALVVVGDGKTALVTRRDRGTVRTLRVPLPAVITVARFAGERAPAIGRDGALEATDLQGVGLQAAELRHRDRCVGRAQALRTGQATMVGAAELVETLKAERLVE